MSLIPSPVWIWGVPLAPLTFDQAMQAIDTLVQERKPGYIVTVNLHTAMLAHQQSQIRQTLLDATFNLADGMPLIWASRLRKPSLPERVAGSDLTPALFALAAARGYRIFILGAAPGVPETAAERLCKQYPTLQIVGTESPPFRDLAPDEEAALLGRIRAVRPDLLFVAFGQPKGDLWVRQHYQQLGVPVTMQVGATIDFLAGKVPRAPRWLQRVGLEWAYRLYQEPRRLFLRYMRNGIFLLRMFARDCWTWLRSGRPEPSP